MTDELIKEAKETSTDDLIEMIESLDDVFGYLGLIPVLVYKIQELEKKNEGLIKELKATTSLARMAN